VRLFNRNVRVTRSPPTTTLGCTSETGCERSGCFAGYAVRRFAPASRLCSHSTGVELLRVPRLLRFVVPLAASSLEFGLPGISTPGIFRPWSFSNLRRLAPPDDSPVLFHTGTTYGIQRTRVDVCVPVFLTGPSEDSPVRDYEARARSSSRGMLITELLLSVLDTELEMKRSSRVVDESTARFPASSPSWQKFFNQLVTPASWVLFRCSHHVSIRHSPDFLQAVSRGRGQTEQHVPRRKSRKAPVPQPAPTAPLSEPHQLGIPKEPRCTARSRLANASVCGNNNLSTPSCDFASRSPSALRHTLATSTRCE